MFLPSTSRASVASLEDLVERDKEHVCDGFGANATCVKVEAVADLPTRFGRFRIVAFWNNLSQGLLEHAQLGRTSNERGAPFDRPKPRSGEAASLARA